MISNNDWRDAWDMFVHTLVAGGMVLGVWFCLMYVWWWISMLLY